MTNVHDWAAVCDPVARHLEAWQKDGTAEPLPRGFHRKAVLILTAMEQGARKDPAMAGRIHAKHVQAMYLPGLLTLPEEDRRTAERAAQAFAAHRQCLEDLRSGIDPAPSPEAVAAARDFFKALADRARKSRIAALARADDDD